MDNALFSTLKDSQVISYLWASSLTVLCYDTVQNLPQEITYIWRSKWSTPKFLYLFLRYWSIFVIIINLVAGLVVQRSIQVRHE
ncbi:hypothetical protein GALMADRAFT_1152028 [Galerina marginata CBS 339.88]|uniref:DUF6533 domain-containing protein n=1 Tax=Galerina marginata (strain CBS 339.88) TaxID=685588 RepID=A0A067S966_GALM3|nr:hypothetical protein GALMADRAFT_1152028 [Galerina marginata CBS 339.88]